MWIQQPPLGLSFPTCQTANPSQSAGCGMNVARALGIHIDMAGTRMELGKGLHRWV